MADVVARVDVSGAERLLESLRAALTDLTPVFRGSVDAYTSAIFREQFESVGQRLTGTRWAPLSLVTIRLRTRRVGGRTARRTTSRVGRARAGFATPGRDTNRLFASLAKAGGPEGLRVITPATYERGTRVRYAARFSEGGLLTHMFGRVLKTPRRVPARPIVPADLPPDVVAEYERLITLWIAEGKA